MQKLSEIEFASSSLEFHFCNTVGKYIFGAPKIRNNFWYSVNFSRLLPIKLLLYQLCDGKSFRSLLNFMYQFVRYFMASFLHCFPYSYCSSNYCNSNHRRSFSLLKAIAKSNAILFAMASKIKKERQLSELQIWGHQ